MPNTDDRRFPGPGRPGPSAPPAETGDQALLSALKSLALEQLGERLSAMFDGADARLLDRAERAASVVHRRIIFEAMRSLHQHRHAIVSTFSEQLIAGFSPRVVRIAGELEISIDDLALREARVVEETIAFSNMEAKAADLYRTLLWEIDRRIDWLIVNRRTPLARDALTPAAIARAFRFAIEPLQLEFEPTLLIYQVFESSMVLDLRGFYEAALRLMKDRGVQASPIPPPKARDDAGRTAARTPAAPGGGPGPAPAVGAAGFGGGLPGGAPAAGLDAHTIKLLGHFARAAAGSVPAYYGDANLAHDLATAAAGRPVTGWSDTHARLYCQRMSLVGRMFNELIDGLDLAEDGLRSFDLLRFAVIKRALRDARFFVDAAHPVRKLVNDLVTMIAVSHATGGDMGERMERLVAEVRAQFDDAAAMLRHPPRPPEPIDEELVERFVAEQSASRDGQRRAVVSRVREIVAAELRLRTADAELPEAVRPLLYGGWSILMAYRLTHYGLDSPEWRRGVELLQRILSVLLPPDGQTPGPRDVAQLSDELFEQLMHVGLPRAKVDAQLGGLWKALEDRGHRRLSIVASHSASDVALAARESLVLDLLLVPERWFHMHDSSCKTRRWLKYLGSSANDGKELRFGEFDSGKVMTISREALLEDLAAQRSEPIDLPPNCRRAFDAIIARRARMRVA